MKHVLFLLLFFVIANAQTYEVVTKTHIYEYKKNGKVYFYRVNNKDVKVGSSDFNSLTKSKEVDWDKALEYIKKKPNGKYKIKLKKENSSIIEYEGLDKETLKKLLKEGYLII